MDFVNDVIDVIRTGNNGKLKELRNFYQKADVFLVDDIDFLVNKESSSEEFIHIFNKVYEAEKKIVITGELSPSELKNRGLSEKLKSRLEWGCVAEITTS